MAGTLTAHAARVAASVNEQRSAIRFFDICPIEYKENLVEIEQKIADVEYDELIIAGDFNGDPNMLLN